jgi:tetratricopeptide (TPR) repeat protein
MAAIDASTERISDGLDQLSRDIDASAERITDALDTGFDRLSLDLQAIDSRLSEINATFHWGFSEIIAGIGHMSDLLSELIKIAKTPVQTVAFNHFEIARDAFRQRLYRECLEELSKAVLGDHVSPGFKLEWRFHQLMGTVRLGFAGMSSEDLQELQNLSQAEESFVLAARYAKVDYPRDAAVAFLSAGWAAYCQGRMRDALKHAEQAVATDPKLGEAFFQAAKVRVALGEVDEALPALRRAIDMDRGYALKAAADGDFQKYDQRLRAFLEALRHEKLQQALDRVRTTLDGVDKTLEELELSPESSGDRTDSDIRELREFIGTGPQLPLVDLIDAAQKVDASIAAIEGKLAVLREATQRARATLTALRFWRENSANAAGSVDLRRLLEFFAPGSSRPLSAVLAAIHPGGPTSEPGRFWSLDTSIAAVEAAARNSTILLTQSVGQISCEQEFELEAGESDQEGVVIKETAESDQEGVIIKRGRFLRKVASFLDRSPKRKQAAAPATPPSPPVPRSRRVIKTHPVTLTTELIRDDLCSGLGEVLASIEFSLIPAGQFMMGERDKQHHVTLTNSFYMGRYPVTQSQWQVVAGVSAVGPTLEEHPSFHGFDPQRPVENVSSVDCQSFIAKLNQLSGRPAYRLPTEAEWEYACRAGSTCEFCSGNDEQELRRYAWCGENSGGTTHPVGQLKPNGWGLFDMCGNVWEWCKDRVCCGGCCFIEASRCRITCRNRPDRERSWSVGFRLVRVIPEQ